MEVLLIIGLIVAGVYLYRRWKNTSSSEPDSEPRDVPTIGRGRRLPPTAYGPYGPDALSGQMKELSQQALDELREHLDTSGNPQVDLMTADLLAAMRYYRIGVSPAMSDEMIEAGLEVPKQWISQCMANYAAVPASSDRDQAVKVLEHFTSLPDAVAGPRVMFARLLLRKELGLA